jgi:HD-GYP domain-containing protein (c-di-GMP phosphodiesterase class II)
VSVHTEWELQVDRLLGDLAGGATAVGLYGAAHPRAVEAVQRIYLQLAELLAAESELAFVLLGEELFVQGRPFTRVSRHSASLIRRFRRREIEHATIRVGVTREEIHGFLEDLARTDEAALQSRPHIQVGRVELSERELGGPDATAGGAQGRKLATVRDRVSVIHDDFAEFTAGHGLAVGDLARVARAIMEGLDDAPDLFRQFALWEGEERWPAIHAHNVAVLSMGLAKLAGAAGVPCADLGIAALVHDIGKLLLPPEITSRELDFAGDELEFMLDHSKLGLEALLQNAQVPPLALIVTFEHHLNYNGTGTPRLARPRRPHPAARLVTVADAFVTLFTARGGRGLLTREGTVAWITEHAGTVLDPDWTGALRQLLDRAPDERLQIQPLR